MHYCTLLIKNKTYHWFILPLILLLFTFISWDNNIPIKILNKLFLAEAIIATTVKNVIDPRLLAFGLIIILLVILSLKVYFTNLILLKAIKYRERYFALFTHDLRGVILNLKDSGDVLNFLIKNHRLDEIQEISRQLDDDGFHALSLLNNMLDWGTLNSYSYQPRFKSFFLSSKVWEIINVYKSAIDSKSISLSVEIENELSVYADEKSIDVVLRNIIANAKSHAPAGGNISIRLEKNLTNQIAFIVTNSVSEFKKHNFEHIQNVLAGKTKPNVGHHGLGLGIILIHEYAKNCDFNLELFFENNNVTFKAVL
jgi:signal transduction histidine kinase